MSIPTDSIIVVRHAEPADQHVTAPNHWIDMPLTDLGRRQADAVADRLARELAGATCRLYSSDLKRTAQTAEPIASRLGVAVQPAPQLREYNNGLADGLSAETLKTWAPELTPPMREILANPGGESWPQFHQRVSAFMERISAAADRPLIVVAHNGSINIILNWWLRAPLTAGGDTPLSFGASLASLTVLRVSPQGKPAVERLNDTCHLQAAGLGENSQPPR
ncbi:MAG TPA: histidine phosphatase family protein [Phycisphaerae bacterium]|nr:histidine phosphatase family protein [Phycisphaerae bacterium]